MILHLTCLLPVVAARVVLTAFRTACAEHGIPA